VEAGIGEKPVARDMAVRNTAIVNGELISGGWSAGT
jgi:hypothetical protein